MTADRTPQALSDGFRAARQKATAAVEATSLIAAARGLVPWARPRSLPAVEYPKVFVVGCPRSGTTWVADILGRHPAVVRGRESHLYPTIEHALGRHGATNPVGWARLLYGVDRGQRVGAMAGLHHYVDRPTLARLGRDVLATARSPDDVPALLARAVLDTYFVAAGLVAAAGPAAGVLVEKTPSHVFFLDDILGAFPEAHVVNVLRDGRDVCVSMALRSRQKPVFPTTAEGRTRLWMRAVEAGNRAAADPRWRDRVTTVRYEALKADPSDEVAGLLSAVGLPATDALVADIVAASDIARFPRGPGEFRHRGEVGTWVEHFSAEDDEQFRALAGPLLLASGYSY